VRDWSGLGVRSEDIRLFLLRRDCRKRDGFVLCLFDLEAEEKAII
jgi:hypothetical protein